nr:transposase [Amycolatopsis sp. WAC 01416]
MVRTDAAGATHAFAAAIRAAGCGFSLGFSIAAEVQAAVLAIPDDAWVPAYDLDSRPRKGAWVAEITEMLDVSKWPDRARVIIRRERPRPGAQLRFTDTEGGQLADLEVHHRSHARVEDRIRCGKTTGLRNLPCRGYPQNKAWLELALAAADLLTWTQALCFTGDLARAEPATFRYRICAIAAKLTRTARVPTLHLDRGGPWAEHLSDITRHHPIHQGSDSYCNQRVQIPRYSSARRKSGRSGVCLSVLKANDRYEARDIFAPT